MSQTSRRSFFLGAAYAAAAARVVGANDRIQLGIIGLGGRGTNHLDIYLREPEVRVAALCDVNQAAREKAQTRVEKAGAGKAAEYRDMRELFADKSVDAVSTATPNHWHALTTIWACAAGKDVYVEKPACHNIYEGQKMVEAARRHNRIVQVGMQSRSTPHKIKAMQMLQDGVIGPVYLAKGICYKRRKSIGHTPDEPVPAGVDWDMFLGPAPMRPFSMNRFRYNWHWFWDTGNGDIGNQGVHEMDIARWGLGNPAWPKSAVSTGAKFVYDDDQETPNRQIASFSYGAKELQFEVRGLVTAPDGGLPVKAGNTVGDLFLGADGWMWVDGDGYTAYKGEGQEKIAEEKAQGKDGTAAHMRNFLEACRSRKQTDLHADIEVGALSADLCHLANISYRVGRQLKLDERGLFVGDEEATQLRTRQYREPYAV
jgi:predicted dehydrogenase